MQEIVVGGYPARDSSGSRGGEIPAVTNVTNVSCQTTNPGVCSRPPRLEICSTLYPAHTHTRHAMRTWSINPLATRVAYWRLRAKDPKTASIPTRKFSQSERTSDRALRNVRTQKKKLGRRRLPKQDIRQVEAAATGYGNWQVS